MYSLGLSAMWEPQECSEAPIFIPWFSLGGYKEKSNSSVHMEANKWRTTKRINKMPIICPALEK